MAEPLGGGAAERRLKGQIDLTRSCNSIADQAARWERLQPAVASLYIGILRKAGPVARSIQPRRPCDYRPWNTALEKTTGAGPDLDRFCVDASRGAWPQDRDHLIDFAITFLEEDPMWFRSGYLKKCFARRLMQSDLTTDHVTRLTPVFRRTVSCGSGLEEFKPLCRLAQKYRPPDLWQWLAEHRNHSDLRVRRNARYMHETGIDWWRLHPLVDKSNGPGQP